MFLAALLLVILFLWFGTRKNQDSGRVSFEDIRLRVHKYSGLDPDSYVMFDENLDMFIKTEQAAYLYTAVECVRNIGLSIVNSDDGHITVELNSLADELGYRGELLINKPRKYLNNKLDYTSRDDVDIDVYDPFWANREAAGEIRANRRG
jgi:hypothetical protein